MTQEFHLSITSLGSDRYLVRTEETAIGVPVAEAQVQWPVAEWLELAQPTLKDPVAELLRGSTGVGDRAIHLQRLGIQLYTALFQDEAIRESWLRAQGIAQNRHEILRFRLGLKDSRLQRLPWEVLQQGEHPLTKRPKLTFARYLANLPARHLPETDEAVEEEGRIRVLMVVASPKDQDHLHLMQEVEHLRRLVGQPSGGALPIEIDVLEQPDRNQLVQQLEQGRYQVLHYAGHSELSDQGGDLFLVNPATGLTERLTGDDLAGILVNNHVALAIFNSCRSGQTLGDDAEVDWRSQNLVQSLVSRGVPSVIAMAEQIPDEVAIAFTRLFYHNLCRGYPIDLSLSRTRQGLGSAFGSDQHYWALPILYLQPEFDGYFTNHERGGDRQLNPDRLNGNDLAILAPSGRSADSLPSASLPSQAPPRVAEMPPPAPVEENPLERLSFPGSSVNPRPFEVSEISGQRSEAAEDAELAAFVKALSKETAHRDLPPLPAVSDEVLLMPEDARGGMGIYDVLPDVVKPGGQAEAALPAEEPRDRAPGLGASVSSAMPLSTRDQETASGPLQPPSVSLPRTAAHSPPERPVILWFALGLVGLVAVMGLGVLTLRYQGKVFPPSSSPTDSSGNMPPNPVPLPEGETIAQAQRAIEEGRYGDARRALERLLTQELQGRSDASVNDAVWALVSGSTQPDLLYVRGRLNWQTISQLGSETDTTNQLYEQRSLAAQAKEAWNRTDDRFLEGRVARGFANLATGNLQEGIDNLEAALQLYEQERVDQADPTTLGPEDVIVLHAYAGLVMAHMRAAGLNPAGLAEDDRLSQASPEEKALLEAQAENEKAIARDYFLTLQEQDPGDWMSPSALSQVNDAPETWHNWLWTPPLLNEWRRVYRYWNEQ